MQKKLISIGSKSDCFSMDVPGNSVNDIGERMSGGAVIEYKSPENDAILQTRCQESTCACYAKSTDVHGKR